MYLFDFHRSDVAHRDHCCGGPGDLWEEREKQGFLNSWSSLPEGERAKTEFFIALTISSPVNKLFISTIFHEMGPFWTTEKMCPVSATFTINALLHKHAT